MADGADGPYNGRFVFGPFLLDALGRRLSHDGEPIALTPKEFDTLRVLVEAGGSLVSKDDLLTQVWPDCNVGDGSLARNISVIRRILGHGVIETVSRHGYRLATPISEARDAPRFVASIAVLPFANLSTGKENDYFGEGLAEQVLSLLAKTPGLKVIGKMSAFLSRPEQNNFRAIGERLKVSTLLRGSVQRTGSRIRVSAYLIDAETESCTWSEVYDRDLTDIFDIQDDMALAIANALRVRLLARTRRVNTEAYQYYLKGQYHRLRVTPESLAKAKDCFENAIAIDQNYPAAYSGLAEYYYTLTTVGMREPAEVSNLLRSAAEKALAIEEDNSEAHSMLATFAISCEFDWKSAREHFRIALASEPVPAVSRVRYLFYYLLPLRRVSEAIAQGRLATETEPLSMLVHMAVAWCLYNSRQYVEAVNYSQMALEIDPNYYFVLLVKGLAELELNCLQESIVTLKRTVEVAPWFWPALPVLGIAYHRASNREASTKIAKQLAGTKGIAFYNAGIGEEDAMFDGLAQLLQRRDRDLTFIQCLALFDRYRSDPRFRALLRGMNLGRNSSATEMPINT